MRAAALHVAPGHPEVDLLLAVPLFRAEKAAEQGLLAAA
jgi:hypothetical protein